MSDHILIERAGAIATVVLNRPEKLNALTKAMWGDLGAALEALSAEDDLRCVILRGAGGKSFSPGNDISEFETSRSTPEQAKAYGVILHRTLTALRSCRHPTLAQIDGICVGGGLEIAALCDLRICGQSSRFGVPINRLGLVMAYPEIDGLQAVWSDAAAALEILLEGRVFGAAEAFDKGLVTRVVADDAVAGRGLRDGGGASPPARPWWPAGTRSFLARLEDPAPLSESRAGRGLRLLRHRGLPTSATGLVPRQNDTPFQAGR